MSIAGLEQGPLGEAVAENKKSVRFPDAFPKERKEPCFYLSAEIGFQPLGAAGVPQATDRLFLDLTDTLPREVKLLADFF